MSGVESIVERLVRLLERAAVDPEEFVGRLGLDERLTFEDIRDGSYVLDASDIVAVSDILAVPIPVLTGNVPLSGHLGVSLRLGLLGDRGQTPDSALAYVDQVLGHMAVLDDILGAEATPARMPMSTKRYGVDAGRESADRIRRQNRLGTTPVGDLVGLVESYGYPVLFRELPEGLHGINVRDERSGSPQRIIVISTRSGWPMQRYTLAHELCHALYDDEGQVIFDHLDEPDVVVEVRAESFARALLLPPAALAIEARSRRLGPSTSSGVWARVVPELMVTWGLSRQALIRSLIADGVANEETLAPVRDASVHSLVDRAGLRERWQLMCGDEHAESSSPMLVRRTVEAFGRGFVSLRFVAEVMGEDQGTAEQMLVDAGWLEAVDS